MKQLAMLISNAGTGTNVQAVIDGIGAGEIDAQITVVVSDSADAQGLTRAEKAKIPIHILTKHEVLEDLLTRRYPVDYVALAGWKKIISDEMIDSFFHRILNVHPGLIPDTPDGTVLLPDGMKGLWNKGKFTNAAIQNFLDEKATYAGSSIHFLTREFDFGPVLGRCYEKVRSDDTVGSLYARLKKKENTLYVDVLSKLCN